MAVLMKNDSTMIGFIVFVAGIIFLLKAIYERKSAIQVNGVISEILEKGGNFYTIVTFTYEGNEYTMEAVNGGTKKQGNVGDAVKIFYRPKKKRVHLEGSNGDVNVAIVILVLGALLIIFGLLS